MKKTIIFLVLLLVAICFSAQSAFAGLAVEEILYDGCAFGKPLSDTVNDYCIIGEGDDAFSVETSTAEDCIFLCEEYGYYNGSSSSPEEEGSFSSEDYGTSSSAGVCYTVPAVPATTICE